MKLKEAVAAVGAVAGLGAFGFWLLGSTIATWVVYSGLVGVVALVLTLRFEKAKLLKEQTRDASDRARKAFDSGKARMADEVIAAWEAGSINQYVRLLDEELRLTERLNIEALVGGLDRDSFSELSDLQLKRKALAEWEPWTYNACRQYFEDDEMAKAEGVVPGWAYWVDDGGTLNAVNQQTFRVWLETTAGLAEADLAWEEAPAHMGLVGAEFASFTIKGKSA